jgi:hypothetical protein
MRLCYVVAGFALVSCCSFDDARAPAFAEPIESHAAQGFPDGVASDEIFADGLENGGISCETATVLEGDSVYTADTITAPNWVINVGPLPSDSNDVVYAFVAGPDVSGAISPTYADYSFTIYLLPSCSDSGAMPSPLAATATIGEGIDLAASGVVSGNTYYLLISGAPSVNPGQNGSLYFATPPSIGGP